MTNKLIVLLLMIFVADVRAAGPAKDFKIVSVNCTLKSGGPAPAPGPGNDPDPDDPAPPIPPKKPDQPVKGGG